MFASLKLFALIAQLLFASSPLAVYADTTVEQSWVQLGRMISSSQGNSDERPYFISSSNNGKIVAISSRTSSRYEVGVYKYMHDNKDWVIMGQLIFGENEEEQVHKIDLSHDGAVLAVSFNGILTQKGNVKIYRFDSFVDDWEQVGDAIVDPDRNESNIAVAISSVGNYVVIGAQEKKKLAGQVRVYRYDGTNDSTSWKQVGNAIYGLDDMDLFGLAVDLVEYGDYWYLAVGAPMEDMRGSVTLYNLDKQDETQQWLQFGYERVVGNEDGAVLGDSISLAHDGSALILAVGFPSPKQGSNERSGAQVYSISTTTKEWKTYGRQINGEESNDATGAMVALSKDGQTLAVGSPGYKTNFGLVRVYYKGADNKDYVKIGDDFVGMERETLGSAIDLSHDGKTITIGSPLSHVKTYELQNTIRKNKSPISFLDVFAILVITVIVAFVGAMAIRRMKNRRASRDSASFSSLQNQETRAYNVSQGNHQVLAAPVLQTHSYESDEDSDDISDEEQDFDSHLREIA